MTADDPLRQPGDDFYEEDESAGRIKAAFERGEHQLTGPRAGYNATFQLPPTPPLHEWQCPACGATTRARMADQHGDEEPRP